MSICTKPIKQPTDHRTRLNSLAYHMCYVCAHFWAVVAIIAAAAAAPLEPNKNVPRRGEGSVLFSNVPQCVALKTTRYKSWPTHFRCKLLNAISSCLCFVLMPCIAGTISWEIRFKAKKKEIVWHLHKLTIDWEAPGRADCYSQIEESRWLGKLTQFSPARSIWLDRIYSHADLLAITPFLSLSHSVRPLSVLV